MPVGNAEYQRLLGLLKSNPNYKLMLDTISKAEGTWGKDAYSTKYGGKKVDWKNGKSRDSIPFGKNGQKTSAHGKYQFMNKTWDGKVQELGLTGFTPEEQDVAALSLAEETGALKKLDDGDIKGAIFSAGKKWMGLPVNEKGDSGAPHQKAQPLSKVLGYFKSNESARAAINNGYKTLNEKNASSNDVKQIELNKKKTGNFIQELRSVNSDLNMSEEEKNAEKHRIKRKYYQDGSMLAIAHNLQSENKKNVEFNDRIKNLQAKVREFNDTPTEVKRKSGVPMKLAKEIEAEYEAFGLKKNDRTFTTSNFDLDDLKIQIKKVRNPHEYIQTEKGLLKYGKSKEEYDAEVNKNAPDGGGIESDIESGTADATATTPEQDAKIKADQAVTKKLADDALAAKKKPPTEFSELSNANTQEIFTDPKFKYTSGKAEIPFDALLGFATGITGMAAADVDIKYRDEKVGEGMLQYAADIAKIKDMGLPPEIEGDLKQKLASAYQTGITNIVRSSNGNRNLVLGNQGQLDQARMSGIVEIAAMDVDRRDKALAAFGEVQQKITEFDAKRDIANNERRYAEDQKTQLAGATLAKAGMENLVKGIAYAKENGPGSANDMLRQKMQFNITGLIKGATPGEIGSPEYLAATQLKHEFSEGRKRTFNDWIATKGREEKDVINNILLKHPEKNPLTNKDANLDDLITFTKDVTGDKQYESEYQKYLGISDLTTNAVAEDTSKIKAEAEGTTKTEAPVEPQHATHDQNVMPIVTQGINNTTGDTSNVPATMKGKSAKLREDAPLVDAQGNALINGVAQKVKPNGMIVGTGATADTKVADDIILGGLNKQALTGKGLTPSEINQLENDKKVRNENDKKTQSNLLELENINKASAERELIFNEQQAANQAKLDLVTK